MLISYLLLIFLGGFAVHRFYLGRTKSAIIMLMFWVLGTVLSFIGLGIFGFGVVFVWIIVDLFLIPGMVSRHNSSLMAALHA